MTTGPHPPAAGDGLPRCVVSARYTDHDGPTYGAVQGATGENSIVKYLDSIGLERVVEIRTDRLTSGRTVEHQMLNGRPLELLYRCFLVPIEEGTVSVWRLCQVERTDEDEEDVGVFWVHFRPKGHAGPLLTLTVEAFRTSTLLVSKEDYILDVGDWSQTDVTLQVLEDGLDATDRMEVRSQHPPNIRIHMMGRLGLMEWITLETYMRWHNMTPEEYMVATPERPLPAEPASGVQQGNITFAGAEASAPGFHSRPSMELMTPPGTYPHSPSTYGLSTPPAGTPDSTPAPYCKYDYNPRRQCRHRATLVFAGGDYCLVGSTPGDQLESLRGQEIIPSPGSGIDLFHCTWGFNWGELPLGISNIRFVGGGQSRKLEEPNVNKAITAAMKARNMTLTNMADLGNSTLQMSTTARRWYKHEIVEIMVILDEYVRKAQMTEGSGASKLIVGAYVSLVEIALRVVCTALNGMTQDTYKGGIAEAKTQVLRTIALSSETFQLTVGVARTAEYHSRMNGRGGGGGGGNGGYGGGGGGGGQQPVAKKQRLANDRNENKVPAHVVAALKNKDGKALCLGFLGDKCTRKQGTCRFVHEAIPDGVSQEVLDWISKQDTKNS